MNSNDYYWIATAIIFISGLCFAMYKRRLLAFYVVAGSFASIAQYYTTHVERLFLLAVIAVVIPALTSLVLYVRDGR